MATMDINKVTPQTVLSFIRDKNTKAAVMTFMQTHEAENPTMRQIYESLSEDSRRIYSDAVLANRMAEGWNMTIGKYTSDREKATEAFKAFYALADKRNKDRGIPPMGEPEVRWFESPQAAVNYIYAKNQLLGYGAQSKQEIRDQASWGELERPWASAFRRNLDLGLEVDDYEANVIWEQMVLYSSWFWPYGPVNDQNHDKEFNGKACTVACDRPVYRKMDAANRLHCETGPAILYKDGVARYYFRGIFLGNREDPELDNGSRLIEQRDTITIKEIDEETNQELKQIKLHLYGENRYLEQSGAELVHEDKYGKLYRRDMGKNTEPLQIVRVINKSPEPDGTFKTYHLRVPPTVETAHAAVAWTFGMQAKDYHPEVET